MKNQGIPAAISMAHRNWHEELFDMLPETKKDRFKNLIGDTLEGFLWCDRTWDAWGYGTMSADDFYDAGDEDTIYRHAVSAYILFLEMKNEATL